MALAITSLRLSAAAGEPAPVRGAEIPSLRAASAPKSHLVATATASPGLPAVRGVRSYRRAEIDPESLRKRLANFRGGGFRLDLGEEAWDLELEPGGIRAPNYTVRHLTARGVVAVAPAPDDTWRGRVRGKPGSKVRVSFRDGRINGFVDEGTGDPLFVEPLDHLVPGFPSVGTGKVPHAVYRERDVVPEPDVSCGLASAGHGTALPLPPPSPTPSPSPSLPAGGGAFLPSIPGVSVVASQAIDPPASLAKPSAGAAAACALVELAVAIDYSMVRGLGSAAAAEKRVNDIYNMVDGLYQDPAINIHIRITEVFIETAQNNTWGATVDISAYLTNLGTWMRGANGFKNPFDIASMWYYHLGGGTVGLAWVGTVCNNNRSNIIRYFTATSRSMMIDAAHEMGHNFSAPHIANSTSIMNASITGSNDKWDASTINSIVTHKNSRTCLSTCNVSPLAAFSLQGPSACADTRTFTDQSAGEPTSWLWEFGDGATATTANPVHKYLAEGKYTAKLTATNAFGSSTASRGDIRVKAMATPVGRDGDGCAPASVVLSAQGAGTLRWYDTAVGGSPIASGPQFTTPVLASAKTYYVEEGEPDLPVIKVGPVATNIGAGALFTANGERRLFFDVARPATLISAKVNAGKAGPRIIEILDSRDKRIMAKTVQVPQGESRIQLGFVLQPGEDYAIKVVGSGDSVNLYRNTAGADYPYFTPDSLVTITGSDATSTTDTLTQNGYYYFFYDWEVRENGCSSVRVPVQAKFTCTSGLADAAGAGAFHAALLQAAPGRYRIEGHAPRAGRLEVSLRAADGSLVKRIRTEVAAGPFQAPVELAGGSRRLLIVDIALGEFHLRKVIPRF